MDDFQINSELFSSCFAFSKTWSENFWCYTVCSFFPSTLYFFFQRYMLRISISCPILCFKAQYWCQRRHFYSPEWQWEMWAWLLVLLLSMTSFFFFKAKLFHNFSSWSWDKQAFQSHGNQSRTRISDSWQAVEIFFSICSGSITWLVSLTF